MKKIFYAFMASVLLMSFSCGGDDDDDTPSKPQEQQEQGGDDQTEVLTLEVNAGNLLGTWDGFVEHDFYQNYYQRWRIKFNGENYTRWHTSQMIGTIYDDVQGLKTVGDKEEGTWKYADGVLTLTPIRQWSSHYISNLEHPKYTYLEYNTETMECENWFASDEVLTKQGVERDLVEGSDFYISYWNITSLTHTVLTVKINKDVFKLQKQE